MPELDERLNNPRWFRCRRISKKEAKQQEEETAERIAEEIRQSEKRKENGK